MHMCNIRDRHDLNFFMLRMLHPECLVQTQFTYTKFFVELCQDHFKLFFILCCTKVAAQSADPIPYPAVKNLPTDITFLIIQNDLQTFCIQTFFHRTEIIVK